MSDTATLDRPAAGHNQPPEAVALLRAELAEADPATVRQLLEAIAPLLQAAAVRAFDLSPLQRARLIEAGEKWRRDRPKVESKDQADRGTDLVALVDEETKRLDAEKEAFGRPFFVAHRAVTGHYKAMAEPLTTIRRDVAGKVESWNAEELKRQRAEAERERRAALKAAEAGNMVEAAEAANKAVVLDTAPARNRSDYGALASTSLSWVGEITDAAKVPLAYCSPDQKKIDAAVKAGTREIPGIKISEKPTTTFRR